MIAGAVRNWWMHAVLACALLTGPAVAQSASDGAIRGRVLSTTGAPVGGAIVTAQEGETGLAVRSIAGPKGEFLIPRLPPGEYTLSVEASAVVFPFAEALEVDAGEVVEAEPRLRNGNKLDVTGPRSRPATVLTASDLASLPPDALVTSTPSANAAAAADEGPSAIAFRGLDQTHNSTAIDGLQQDEGFSGTRAGAGVSEDTESGADEIADRAAGLSAGARSTLDGGQRAGSAYAFAQAAVREFRVSGQSDAASYGSVLYGHGVGGVITSVTRSGGTVLHGMAFYTQRNSAWAAMNPFSIATTYSNGAVSSAFIRPQDIRQQFGGRIGGPLVEHRDGSGRSVASRTSYFYAFDQQLRNFPAISSPGYAGFYNLTRTQTAVLANRGVSSAKITAALNYLSGLTGEVPRRADQTIHFGRIDWARDGGSRLIFEYNRARWSNPSGARSGAVVDRGRASVGSSYGNIDAFAGRWVQVMTPHVVNELRAQYNHQLQYETAQAPLSEEPAVGPGGLAPEVSIGPQGLVFGTPASLGRNAYPDERRLEFADVLAWTRGGHFLQLGADFSALRDFTDSLTNAEGTFTYDSGNTNGHAGGLVDWITDYTFGVNAYPNGGCPTINATKHNFCFRSYSQSFGAQSVTFNTQEWAGFVQDDWQIADRLTLHAGVRYEYEFLPLPQQPNPGLDAAFSSVGATGRFPEDRNNFGPRLGVAWQPFGAGRGTIRIGYGVYFGKLPGATIRSALLDTAVRNSTTHIRILPTTETVCPQNTQVGFGYPCSYLTQPPAAIANTTSAMLFSRRFRLPMVQQGTFSLEHPLPWGIVGSAGYVMNLDRQLPSSVDINIAPSTTVREFQLQGGTGKPGARDGEIFYLPVYTARVDPSFGPVTAIVSNADATYHGMTLQARRGLGGRPGLGGIGTGLEFRLAWTWSKAIDYGQNSGATPRANGQFDPFHIGYDKGLSALNFPQRVVGTAVWSPRWLSASSEFAGKVANGWSIASIFSESSGRAYSYDVFGGTRLNGGRESINGSGGSLVLPTAGRNTLRLPAFANVDLRLSRNVRVTESLRVRAAIQAFNVTNHVNYSGVSQRAYLVGTAGNGTAPGVTPLIYQDAATIASEGLNTQPFGTYTDASTSQARERQIELNLRLEF